MEIEENDFQQMIRFYEEHELNIKQLEFEEYFELLVTYVNALFETGAYERHLVEVDVVIENSILRNIQYFKGEDIYRRMLFKKAASHFNLKNFKQAEYVLRELIKIDPFDKDPILFLKKCLRKSRFNLIKVVWAIAIFLILVTAFVVGVEILWVSSLHTEYATLIRNIRFGTLISTFVILVLGNFFHRIRIERDVKAFVEKIKDQKLKGE